MQYRPEPENTPYQQNPAPFQNTSEQRVSASTPDQHYDLVSVLYHALSGAQTYARYAEDAGRGGDQELAQFFAQTQQMQISCAEKAKQLLGRRLTQTPVH